PTSWVPPPSAALHVWSFVPVVRTSAGGSKSRRSCLPLRSTLTWRGNTCYMTHDTCVGTFSNLSGEDSAHLDRGLEPWAPADPAAASPAFECQGQDVAPAPTTRGGFREKRRLCIAQLGSGA